VLWGIGFAAVALALAAGAFTTFAGMVTVVALVFAYLLFSAVDAALAARRAEPFVPRPYARWYGIAGLLVLCSLPSLLSLPASRVRAFKVPSGSMEPTLLIGDSMIADMKAWERREPERGDLVLHRSPEGRMMIRRVIALPGERVELRDKAVWIDGAPIEEPWAVHTDPRTIPASRFAGRFMARDQFGPLVVPEGTLFLLGDNRDNSNDSRFHGPIDRSLLAGRPLYVYWSADASRIGRALR
jgi:signal peptidase I